MTDDGFMALHCVLHNSYAEVDEDRCLWAQQHDEDACLFAVEIN